MPDHVLMNRPSRPVRARGLKHYDDRWMSVEERSRPVRARGLKRLVGFDERRSDLVAPSARVARDKIIVWAQTGRV